MAIIGVDVDDVCLDLMSRWLSKYNYEFNDTVRVRDILGWDIHNFIKPEAHQRIYEYIEDDELFLSAKPVIGSLEVISWLKRHHRIIYITAHDPLNCKFTWLLNNGFIDSVDDLVVAYDKYLIKSTILIDDKYENVNHRDGGWLFTRPWNKKYDFKNRVKNWYDIKSKVRKGIIKL